MTEPEPLAAFHHWADIRRRRVALVAFLARGLLSGRQRTKGQPWQIDLSEEKIIQLRERLRHTRRSRKEASRKRRGCRGRDRDPRPAAAPQPCHHDPRRQLSITREATFRAAQGSCPYRKYA